MQTQPMYRTPARFARLATDAAETLNSRGIQGPRPFRMCDIIHEAIAAGLPEVLKRRGLEHLIAADPPGESA